MLSVRFVAAVPVVVYLNAKPFDADENPCDGILTSPFANCVIVFV